MKIAVIVSNFPSLSETFILNQITGLIDQGHEVDIYAQRKPKEEIIHHAVQQYGLLNKVHYFPQIPNRKIVCRLKALGYLLTSFIFSFGKTSRTLKYCLRRPAGFSYPILFQLLIMIKKEYQILLCHFGYNGNIGLHLKKIQPKIKLITMFHGNDVRLGLEIGETLYKELFQIADMILVNSGAYYEKLIELGCPAGKTKIHYEVFDFSKFKSPSQREKFQQKEPIQILTVGRLVKEKGLEDGIRAFRLLLDRNPGLNIQYLIVGGGPLQNILECLIRDLGLDEKVLLSGPVDSEKVVQYLHQSDIFFFPSIQEALGVALMEAQAAGLPVVASEVGGIPEAVRPGVTAFLVPPGDIGGFAEKLNLLLHDRPCRERMSAAGPEFVKNTFDGSVLNHKLVEMMQALLDRG